ncbi:GNAT family N-acetyltransferase [Patescibacteria group bacterium]|nr:GNAT family N-acetyltransferase [Patescibacteria group bacterium]
MTYSKITKENFEDWLNLGMLLWPDHSREELRKDFSDTLESHNEEVFGCKNDQNELIAFISLSIRSDYVEGSSTSPAGYVEGIFVKPDYRNQGIANKLVKMGEEWTVSKGCTEIGSDAEIENVESQKFHKKIGFKEANRIVSFIKKLS